MMQWLASTEMFAYPSNLLSRFYGSPYIGAGAIILADTKKKEVIFGKPADLLPISSDELPPTSKIVHKQ
ncbi:unnamed protein product, partial [marine sediment metagenome]